MKNNATIKSCQHQSNSVDLKGYHEEMAAPSSSSSTVSFTERLEVYRDAVKGLSKNTFVLRALDGVIDESMLNEYILKLQDATGDSDFFIIAIIRLLYLARRQDGGGSPAVRAWLPRLTRALCAYPFWPHTDGQVPLQQLQQQQHKKKLSAARVPTADGIVFWSENHTFMLLTSAVLLRQYLYEQDQVHELLTITDREELLLSAYLRAHVQFGGVYEVLSHVYLPYTLSALLNLVDFAPAGGELQTNARCLIHTIVRQLLLCTTPNNGVCSLTASCRAYERTRERTHGHNVNQLVLLLTGKSPDGFDDTALTDFLLTTSWRPSAAELQDYHEAFHFQGSCQVEANHPALAGRDVSAESRQGSDDLFGDVPLEERVPFYWSAGLITHTRFIRDTLAYHRQKHMQKNVHLWPLTYLPPRIAEAAVARFSHFSHGQCYAGVTLNVYKHGDACLTSFERYQGGVCGYQQLPWIANCGGVGVWTQSGGFDDITPAAASSSAAVAAKSTPGPVSRDIRMRVGVFGSRRLRLRIPATHTHQPHVTQRGPLLVAAYVCPSQLRGLLGDLLGTMTRLYWPAKMFDEERRGGGLDGGSAEQGDHQGWWVARRNDSLVGVFCTQPTSELEDESCVMQAHSDCAGVPALSRMCHASAHSWIVLMGRDEEYRHRGGLATFRARCQGIQVSEARVRTGAGGMTMMGLGRGVQEEYVVTVIDTAATESEALCVRVII